jgi:hypothetical protein
MRDLSTTRLLPIAYTTKYSILSLLTFHRVKQGSHVRVSIMQLSFIELLHVSAQPLHKVKISIRKPRKGYAFGACLPQTIEGKSRQSLASVVPQELLNQERH